MRWDAMEGDMDPDPRYGRAYEDDEYEIRDEIVGYPTVAPKYQFNTLEDLVTSTVFQEQLGLALQHKQKQIDSLRLEVIELDDRINDMTQEHNWS